MTKFEFALRASLTLAISCGFVNAQNRATPQRDPLLDQPIEASYREQGIGLEPSPDEAKKFYKQGVTYGRMKLFTEAAAAFELAILLKPNYGDAFFGLGHAYYDLGRWNEAKQAFRRVIQLDPKDDEAHEWLRKIDAMLARKEKGTTPTGRGVVQNNTPAGSKVSLDSRTRPNPAGPSNSNPANKSSETARTPLQNLKAPPNPQSKASGTVSPQRSTTSSDVRSSRVPPSSPNVPANNSSKSLSVPNVAVNKTIEPPSTKTSINSRSDKAGTNVTPLDKQSSGKAASERATASNVGPKPVSSPNGTASGPTNSGSSTRPGMNSTPVSQTNPAPSGVPKNASNRETISNSPTVPVKKEILAATASANPRSEVPDARGAAKKPAIGTSKLSPISSPVLSISPISVLSIDEAAVVRVAGEASKPASDAGGDAALSSPKAAKSEVSIYRVGIGDVLDVRVSDLPADIPNLFTVSAGGLLDYPVLNEPLKVLGLTAEEVGERLRDELKRLALSEAQNVVVAVHDYNSHTILVSGLVSEPGTKVFRREAIPLYVVLAEAQPLPEAGRVSIISNEGAKTASVDLSSPQATERLIRPGDVVLVQSNPKLFFYIGGDVKEPGEKPFRQDLKLTQAILIAGGLSRVAKAAELAREGTNGLLEVTLYKWTDIQSGKVPDPIIQPGDRITILH